MKRILFYILFPIILGLILLALLVVWVNVIDAKPPAFDIYENSVDCMSDCVGDEDLRLGEIKPIEAIELPTNDLLSKIIVKIPTDKRQKIMFETVFRPKLLAEKYVFTEVLSLERINLNDYDRVNDLFDEQCQIKEGIDWNCRTYWYNRYLNQFE